MKTNFAEVESELADDRVSDRSVPRNASAEVGAESGFGPGRPCGCTGELVGLLRGLIRELGLSDSAAARRLGIGVSTLSRWKRADPEVRLLLQQAREECRAIQLQRIMHAAGTEHGRGWRAAAWLLERLFPEDYARDAGAREGHRSVAEARERREEQTAEAEVRTAQARQAAEEKATRMQQAEEGGSGAWAQRPQHAKAGCAHEPQAGEVEAQAASEQNSSVLSEAGQGYYVEETKVAEVEEADFAAAPEREPAGDIAVGLTSAAGFQLARQPAPSHPVFDWTGDTQLAAFYRQMDAAFA